MPFASNNASLPTARAAVQWSCSFKSEPVGKDASKMDMQRTCKEHCRRLLKLAAGKVTWASVHTSTSPSMHASDAILLSHEAIAPMGSEALPFRYTL
jgi:hypothetical protein